MICVASQASPQAPLYTGRSKYAGWDVNEAKRLRELEIENNKLKKLLTEKRLEAEARKEVRSNKG